ncbi:hypothetical protein NMG60_11007634 [Bertholletia excelsa]
MAMREALKNLTCTACGGPPPPFGEERQLALQKLRMENAQLKQEATKTINDENEVGKEYPRLSQSTQEYQRLSQLAANFLGKPFGQIQSMSRSLNLNMEGFATPGDSSLDLHLSNFTSAATSTTPTSMHHLELSGSIQEMEKSMMIESAVTAMVELIRLLRVNEPVWAKCPTDETSYLLHLDTYNKLFPRSSNSRGRSFSAPRVESSKDSGLVAMNAMHLVNMFMDPSKYIDLFPTMVTKARTIEQIETRMLGDQAGPLQLMYERMHILSPLVAPREFYFLRYCKEIEQGVWVVVDVSHDSTGVETFPAWKCPSGCMLQDKPNGCCEVTWVEHVEVDEKFPIHHLYRDLVTSTPFAYGAKRWIVTLQRMAERFAFSTGLSLPGRQFGAPGLMDATEGRRSLVELSLGMVKNFWGTLTMSGRLDFPSSSGFSESTESGVRVSIRQSNGPGQPGVIVSAASSTWLPLPCETLFDFFRDENNRIQWDVLSSGNPVQEIARISISSGSHPGNCVSILQPSVLNDGSMLILQESCKDPLGSLVIYAPIDFATIKSAITSGASSEAAILPSGFIISTDGRSNPSAARGASTSSSSSKPRGGSLLTVVFQILVCSPSHSQQLSMESLNTVNDLVNSTLRKVKAALDCSDGV